MKESGVRAGGQKRKKSHDSRADVSSISDATGDVNGQKKAGGKNTSRPQERLCQQIKRDDRLEQIAVHGKFKCALLQLCQTLRDGKAKTAALGAA